MTLRVASAQTAAVTAPGDGRVHPGRAEPHWALLASLSFYVRELFALLTCPAMQPLWLSMS